MALIRDGVWGIVNGSEQAPEERSDAHRNYTTRSDRALSTVVLSIDLSLLYLVGDPDDPADVWKKLGDQFQKKVTGEQVAIEKASSYSTTERR